METIPSTLELNEKAADAVMAARMLSDAEICDLAYIEACELDSPNSPDFARMRNRIEDRMHEEQYNATNELPRG